MPEVCCELTDQFNTSVPCCTSVAIKESVAALLAAEKIAVARETECFSASKWTPCAGI